MIFTLWQLILSDDVEELTLIDGSNGPEGHSLLATFDAVDADDACRQRNELLGWEPYKPMEPVE